MLLQQLTTVTMLWMTNSMIIMVSRMMLVEYAPVQDTSGYFGNDGDSNNGSNNGDEREKGEDSGTEEVQQQSTIPTAKFLYRSNP